MPDLVVQAPSFGVQLLNNGLRQGAVFPAALLETELLVRWADFRSDPKLRTKAIKSKDLLVVTSQDCDIACRNDAQDPCIELAVFSPIKSKSRHAGSQFANSVRVLQLSINDQDCEAKARYTIRVPKEEIFNVFAGDYSTLFELPAEQCRTLTLWRANRYQRAALPDRFNDVFFPIVADALPAIELLASDPAGSGRSYIRSLYVYLENMSEEGGCEFSLLALLRADTPDSVQSALDDAFYELCVRLENTSDYSLSESQDLTGLAERENTLTVFMLGQYVKFNLDYISLREGDPDTGA
jgi:hypothetical protein